jgi:hypothetical protein
MIAYDHDEQRARVEASLRIDPSEATRHGTYTRRVSSSPAPAQVEYGHAQSVDGHALARHMLIELQEAP